MQTFKRMDRNLYAVYCIQQPLVTSTKMHTASIVMYLFMTVTSTFSIALSFLFFVVIRRGGGGVGGGSTLSLDCVWNVTALQIPDEPK